MSDTEYTAVVVAKCCSEYAVLGWSMCINYKPIKLNKFKWAL